MKAEINDDETQAGTTDRIPCPCCGHTTLSERERYEICPVCFWEDDGRGDDTLDDPGGPNRVTLRKARENYAAFGANCEEDRPHVREPIDEERRAVADVVPRVSS